MFSFVLLSGGNGTRMHRECPKQYLLLAGKPIIMHTIERVEQLEEVCELIVVCEKQYESLINKLVHQYNIRKKIVFAEAGRTRQESVYSGIQKVSNSSVIIHEAARPFVTIEEYKKLINETNKNVSFAYDIPFSVVKGDLYIKEILNRSELKNIQLPQKFDTIALLNAHKKAVDENLKFTEDAGMLTYYKEGNVKLIKGSSYNIKLTEPVDLLLGEILYKEYFMGRK